jgi:hypothetical protein
MSKIQIKNSQKNALIRYIKDNNISFTTGRDQDGREKVVFSPRNRQQNLELLNTLRNYGSNLYHDTLLQVDPTVINEYSYVSNQYENMTSANNELELPLYYIENTNIQNEKYKDLKAIPTQNIIKNHIENILNLQQALLPRSSEGVGKFQNIFFGTDFRHSRTKKFLSEFPYHNRLQYVCLQNNDFIGEMLKKYRFQEEMFGSISNPENPITTNLQVNEEEVSIQTYDILDIVQNSKFILDESDKIILATAKQNSNYLSNNFKKFLLVNYLDNKMLHFTKRFQQIYNNEPCEKEYIIYKIQKFKDTDTTPMQTFWAYDENFKEYIDYQIKLDATYRYLFTAYTIIYGTTTRIENVSELRGNQISVDFVRTPSYRMAILDFDEISLKVTPKIQMPPFVSFQNESNSKNFIKIYLDLKNSSMKEKFIDITTSDSSAMTGVVTDEEGRVSYEYSKEDGKFEVFRLSERPESYRSFENAKILDVRNKHSSTSVVFKDNVMPNKKYYYMFRAINVIGTPSNPTPVYEVELIKDASKSKVNFKKIELSTDKVYLDKNFKSLLQIRPAFQQDIFDDQDEFVESLPTFNKKINDISLGTATDKVWGKKFKIRVKSKDSGKIIDLNVKFNLIKDNIK